MIGATRLRLYSLLIFLFFFQENGRWFITIEPKTKKKSSFLMFGAGDNGKKVHMFSRESAKHLANVIERIRTSQE